MNADALFVRSVYPDARSVQREYGWKVYDRINNGVSGFDTWVSLSATLASERDAWADAAIKIKEKAKCS